jgi:hypothetical protein
VVVIGTEGDSEFLDVFTQSAERWADAAMKANVQATVIGRKPAEEASVNPIEKEQLRAALEAQPKTGSDPLWLVFIGHGTFDGREAKVNLRGPDISQNELLDWLRPFSRPVAVIDCTSASAPFLTKLSVKGMNRVIITATRTGSEINYARFGMFLSQSIIDPAADLDKDGQTSLLEAFLAASDRTAEFYKTESRLATEHALLDDNGDGLGTSADFFEGIRATKPARNGAAVDGPRAHQWVLLQTAEELALNPQQKQQRLALERQVESLRAQKASLPEETYYARLDVLMLQLAKVYGGVPSTQGAPIR